MIDTELMERNIAVMQDEDNCGAVSDGDHTFAELYRHRAVLTAALFNFYPAMTWKSKKHADGAMYEGYFVAGIETPYGQATYHYPLDCWDLFHARELKLAPAYDGHSSDEALDRIRRMFCDGEAEQPICGGMGIEDTAVLMLSGDYKERFIAEYWQLSRRYRKLLSMLKDWDAGTLKFTPTCPRSTYDLQIKAMSDYLAVLEARAVMECIDLTASANRDNANDH